jgi:predicted nicotinamide N-methyase
VTASEVDELAVAAIELNARANGVTVAVTRDVLDGDSGDAHVVLAGDVFYQRAMAERVVAFLGRARGRGAGVLVGDPGRAYLPRAGLVALARYEVPVTRALEDTDVKRTTVRQLVGPGQAQCSSGAGSGSPGTSAAGSFSGAVVRLSAT